jgi:CRP-like cAMP-binding protein
MTEIILREMNSDDLDWMTSVGRTVEVAKGDRLLLSDITSGRFYWVLEGQFALILPDSNRSQSAIITYSSGDVIGFFFLLNSRSSTVVQAIEKSLLLTIDCRVLTEKLRQDTGFRIRFYRALAMLFSRKQRQIASQIPEVLEAALQAEMLPDIAKISFSIFGNLHDSDMCWMTSAGEVQQLKANEIYVREGQPLEVLAIVLEGSLLIDAGNQNAPSLFETARRSQTRNIVEANPGDILGITAFLNRTPNLHLIRTTQDTRLLSVPIASLLPRLQADSGFADRFYRALAFLMAEQLHQSISYLGESMQPYEPGCSLCDKSEYEGELSIPALQQLSIARTKFNWLQQQLGVKDRI